MCPLMNSAEQAIRSTGCNSIRQKARIDQLPAIATQPGKMLRAILVFGITASFIWANLAGILTINNLGSSSLRTSLVASAAINNHSSLVARLPSLKTDQASQAQISEMYGRLPLSFEANQGQVDSKVKFFSRGAGYGLFLSSTEAVLSLGNQDAPSVLRMKLIGAGDAASITGLDELPGKSNYFIGKDPTRWRTRVPNYRKVKYQGIYPGVDLVYYGNQRQLEYDFIVAPGFDPDIITLGFENVSAMEIDAQGDLVLRTAKGEVRQRKPVIYQEANGIRLGVSGGYVFKGKQQIGFQVGAYDIARPLIIDPVLIYSTYLGGSGDEIGRDIAVDPDGNAYIIGRTSSGDFPTTAGAFQTEIGNIPGQLGADIFVARIDTAGANLVYSTYLGGSGYDDRLSIALDAFGNACLTGHTDSVNFPTTPDALQAFFAGGNRDAFVAKLNAQGNSLLYSTYLGGGNEDTGNSIAVDSAGNAYITGFTLSANFPTTSGAVQTGSGGADDLFISKLNPAGAALVYSTYIGGERRDEGFAIAVDSSGSAYVTGKTQSANFPVTPGAFQTSYGNREMSASIPGDAFVAKLNPTGSALVYSTYLGGHDFDEGRGIAVDPSGNAYVAGGTASLNFPTTPNAYQTATGSRADIFVTKLNAEGNSLVYSTYIGGNGSSACSGIAIDSMGNAYLAGSTGSTNFPTENPLQDKSASGPLFKSTDDEGSWTVSNNGLTARYIRILTVDPTDPATLYANGPGGLFRTTDGGRNWTMLSQESNLHTLIVNPANPSVLYAGGSSALLRSTDRGASWRFLGFTYDRVNSLAIHPANPTIIYVGGDSGVSRSTDAGESWKVHSNGMTFISPSGFPSPFQVKVLAIDPVNPSTIYAGTSFRGGIFKSTDGGINWSSTGLTFSSGGDVVSLVIDPVTPSTLYAVAALTSSDSGIFKSTDGGASWRALRKGAFDTLAINPTAPSTIYAGNEDGLFKSADGGENWTEAGIAGRSVFALAVAPTSPSATLYAGTASGINAVVVKLRAEGNWPVYSTYLGGMIGDEARSVAVDPADNVYVIGVTRSANFPTVNPLQSNLSGPSDIFIAKIAPAPIIARARFRTDKNPSRLQIIGAGFSERSQVEINGIQIAPPRVAKFNPAKGRLAIQGSADELKLRSGENEIVVIENGNRSAPFRLKL